MPVTLCTAETRCWWKARLLGRQQPMVVSTDSILLTTLWESEKKPAENLKEIKQILALKKHQQWVLMCNFLVQIIIIIMPIYFNWKWEKAAKTKVTKVWIPWAFSYLPPPPPSLPPPPSTIPPTSPHCRLRIRKQLSEMTLYSPPPPPPLAHPHLTL